jgi:NADPH-dependent glutamate synthase beta subunit-like oxidoreductase
MGPDDAPYWDVVGGSGRDYPPRSQRTAEDLIVMLTARDLGATVEGLDQGIERATRFLLRMQFTERNSYAYPDADRRIGAFRKQSDRKLVDLGGVSTAMEALALELELRDRETPKQ